MKTMRRIRGLGAALAGLACSCNVAAAATFYVAPDGRDAWSGQRATPNGRKTDGPFATLERARDEVRRLKKRDGVTVFVRGGRYQITQTFALKAEDSGTTQAPVVYRACKGEQPVFSGGVRLTGFQPVREAAILARLPAEARGQVVQVDLKAQGVTHVIPLRLGGFAGGLGFSTHPTMELFFNGQALPLARWPNTGFVHVADVAADAGKTGPIRYDGDRPQRWKDDQDILLYGYWFHDWADSYERVASIDTARHEITLAPPYTTYGYRKGQRYYAVNLFSELDMPGEWYLDRSSGTLYLYPPADPNQAVVELSTAVFPLVEMDHVSHVTLQGLTWELGGADGILVKDGAGCLLAGCTIRRLGGNGVEIHGGTGHKLRSCDIYSLGRGGAVVEGGNRKTLTPGRHLVENCDIYDLSRIDHTYTPAVVLSGVGHRIAHNAFHDIGSSAIRLGGNDHVVEFNEVYRVVRESDDQGGVDMWGDPTYRGNVIRYNYWHHIGNWRHTGAEPGCGQAGVRLDDAISGVLVLGNVFFRCGTGRAGFGGIQIHGGKDNIVSGNLFADCRTAISFSAWGDQRWRAFTSRSLESQEIDAALYGARYPELARLAEDHDVNLVCSNLVYKCDEFLRRDSGRNKLVDNIVTQANPGFTDAARGIFRPAKNTPVQVRAIPFDQIGLYRDEFRLALPTRAISEARAAAP